MSSIAAEQPEAGDNKSQVANDQTSFTSHVAKLKAGEDNFILRVLKMNGSTFLIFGAREHEVFEELGMALPMRPPSNEILSSTILGGIGHSDSAALATKLSKRYGRQFFVSLNLKLDRISMPLFDKELSTYMHDHLEYFV
ncbi:uncharacterized protein LOC115634107 [Scaptodrosophila lebanonensis]|uniref:Uncharacterized protein LOC115634107 n=1 Tax=Drosophila lebanonensis TaxID=7225 RepID=A0A6J2UHB9_DROLE|nr:uncharacterized protein LOC115634107 [Scaptodrosophila lebanonensis]